MFFEIEVYYDFFIGFGFDLERDKLANKLESLEIDFSICGYLIYNKNDILVKREKMGYF